MPEREPLSAENVTFQYDKAGMYRERYFSNYARLIREGRELSTQTVEA